MVLGPRELLAGPVGLGVAELTWSQAQVIRGRKSRCRSIIDGTGLTRSLLDGAGPGANWIDSRVERIIDDMAEEHGRPIIKWIENQARIPAT
jgi:hypothetical protein